MFRRIDLIGEYIIYTRHQITFIALCRLLESCMYIWIWNLDMTNEEQEQLHHASHSPIRNSKFNVDIYIYICKVLYLYIYRYSIHIHVVLDQLNSVVHYHSGYVQVHWCSSLWCGKELNWCGHKLRPKPRPFHHALTSAWGEPCIFIAMPVWTKWPTSNDCQCVFSCYMEAINSLTPCLLLINEDIDVTPGRSLSIW